MHDAFLPLGAVPRKKKKGRPTPSFHHSHPIPRQYSFSACVCRMATLHPVPKPCWVGAFSSVEGKG